MRIHSSSFQTCIARDGVGGAIALISYEDLDIQDVSIVSCSAVDGGGVFFGTGIRVFHTLKNIPMMVAGGGGIGLRRGQHFAYNEDVTPLGNLWVSVLHQFGIEAAQFGDSSGDLDEIFRS